MITREEAKDLFRLDTDAYGKPKAIMTKINKIYDSFEKHNKSLEAQLNTEQLKCVGCKFSLIDGTSSKFYIDCKDCIRSGSTDNYIPKDTK